MKRIKLELTEDQLKACKYAIEDWLDKEDPEPRNEADGKAIKDYNAFLIRLRTKLQAELVKL